MNFFKKLFGKSTSNQDAEELLSETLDGIFSKSGFDLEYELRVEKTAEGETLLFVELSGPDEELLKERKGQVLDAMQLILKRVVQHRFAEERISVSVDCGGYRQENEAALIERAESLKQIAIEQGKSVYYRALPPKDRKVVHQYLAQDPRVKSRSLGDGLYKKIKIYPAKAQQPDTSNTD
jgi:spoIIIJ-associated protein